MFSVFYINILILLFVFSMIAKAIKATKKDILNAILGIDKFFFYYLIHSKKAFKIN